jgi:peptide/nickel transport system ATP-binding protein
VNVGPAGGSLDPQERIRWYFADLQDQWRASPVSLSQEGSALSARSTRGSLTLTPALHGAALDLEVPGSTRRFFWADPVGEWFLPESGLTLTEALGAALPDAPPGPPRVLVIDEVRTFFHTEDAIVKAVDGLTVSVRPGRTLGIVGESGSGKSVTSLTIMGLLPDFTARVPTGSIAFFGRDLLSMRRSDLAALRGDRVAMIFQEPMTSLNPVFRVGDQVAEAVRQHRGVSHAQAMARAVELFREVGIPDPEARVRSYPHEMSGGQKQRVMIAMALACDPQLLIADEPTTALDVTIQKQILDLLRRLRDTRGMAMLFITHDLGVIAEIADDVAVMYRGKLVEHGDVLEVFRAPKHPYTRGLLACRPRLDTPYRLLPTVADFLSTTVENGEVVVREKPLDPDLERRLRDGARGKRAVVEGEPVLRVQDLVVTFPKAKKPAVDGISFDVWPGQTLGLVGESGCGKTTTGRAILRLIPIAGGSVTWKGQDLTALQGGADRVRRAWYAVAAFLVALCFAFTSIILADVAGLLSMGLWPWVANGTLLVSGVVAALVGLSRSDPTEQALRRQLQIIFQDPYSSLNPRMSVGDAIIEAMRVHKIGENDADREKKAGDLLEEVGLERKHLRRFPHEFSGGQRQRICIARTLALEPSLIICDESVSALDVSVQAQVLNLLRELQERRGLTYIFISHDLSVVKFMSDTMCVMKDGKIVEAGPSEAIYANPTQEYTRALIQAIPSDDLAHIETLRTKRQAARAERLHQAREQVGGGYSEAPPAPMTPA